MSALLELDVRHAVERKEIVAYYQPQIEVATGKVVSVEALARWVHPELGLIPPDDFIPVAERLGCIRDIGRHMLDLSCRQTVRWVDDGLELQMSVNVSASELSGDNFCTDVLETLAICGTDPALVTLEITETGVVVDPDVVNGCLKNARDAGLGISVDDYGTGHSSLNRMYRLHATELKLDRTLIESGTDAELTMAVKAAHDTGARVVAEGIETEAHLQRAADLDCDRAQGYFIARPMPPEQLLAFVRSR